MAKTQGHDARTHLPKHITIAISASQDQMYNFYIYEGSPSQIDSRTISCTSGWSFSIQDTVDKATVRAKDVIAEIEKENRSECELAHDLSEIRNRKAAKDNGITR